MDTNEIQKTLDNIKIGDKLAINDWKAKYLVSGISEHYILAHYGRCYTIIRRQPVNWPGYCHNGVRHGDYVIAPDWWSFGCPLGYEFTSEEWTKKYLYSFETGETEQSMRKEAPLWFISIVGHTDKVFAKKETPSE